jgi:methylmalonyl-CoA mutase cobalamin-binding subunit
MTHIKSASISQAAVEQLTGLSREVLRKWELRYQFPVPVRGARGQRLYTPEDVQILQLIKRLVNRGLRPVKLMPPSLDRLHELLATHDPEMDADQTGAAQAALLACLGPGAAPGAVFSHLEGLIKDKGLAGFAAQHLPAFNRAVGDAWASGRLGVHAEHHYSEAVRQVVLRAMAQLHPVPLQPRVLLTTPPGELHTLGLLAVQAALTVQGAHCICLGSQTPVADVVQAVNDWGVKLVAVSVSACLAPDLVRSYVRVLRQRLPAACGLWVGGQGGEFLAAETGSRETAGLLVFQSVHQAVQGWMQLTHKPPKIL